MRKVFFIPLLDDECTRSLGKLRVENNSTVSLRNLFSSKFKTSNKQIYFSEYEQTDIYIYIYIYIYMII